VFKLRVKQISSLHDRGCNPIYSDFNVAEFFENLNASFRLTFVFWFVVEPGLCSQTTWNEFGMTENDICQALSREVSLCAKEDRVEISIALFKT
jgi:hypothetical protein